jgi:BRCT domain type II-containing protein
MLDRLLSMVKRGQPVRIVYGGKVAMEGGSSKHVFTVAAKPASPATMETIKAIEPF